MSSSADDLPEDAASDRWRGAIGRGWKRGAESLLPLAAAFADDNLPLSALEPLRGSVADLLHAVAGLKAEARNIQMANEYRRLRDDEGWPVEEALAEVGDRFGISASSAENAIRRPAEKKFSDGRRRRWRRKQAGSTLRTKSEAAR